nr:hypothetical protein [Stenotrophomonas sp. S49]
PAGGPRRAPGGGPGAPPGAARAAWERGLCVAGSKGDQQAQREMQVFLRRLDRADGAAQVQAG